MGFCRRKARCQADYIALTPETAKKAIVVSDKEAGEILKNDAGLKAAQAHYEQTKYTYMSRHPRLKKASKSSRSLSFRHSMT